MRSFALALLAFSAPIAARAEALELWCHGTALHTEASQTFADIDSNSGASASGSASTYRRERSDEALRIRLDENGGGKLKMPASLIPPLSRGRDGWWDFVKLDTDGDMIRGQISLNMLNKPIVMVDRRSGDIDVKGLNIRFQGTCEKVPDAAERKF